MVDKLVSDYIVFVNIALFWVYMKRQNRWEGFMGAIGGKYKINPAVTGTSTATTPAQAANNATLPNVQNTTGATNTSTAGATATYM